MRRAILPVYALILTVFSSCMDIPDEVIMPQWDVDLNIPLADRTYILDEIIKSQNYISISPADSIYLITSDDYKYTTGITGFIKVIPESANLGNEVTTNNNDSIEIYLEFPEGAKVGEAELVDGTVKITAHNPSAELVTLSVRIPGMKDINGSELVVDLEIPPGDSATKMGSLKDLIYLEPENQLFLFKGQLWMIAKASTVSGANTVVTFDAYTSNLFFKRVNGYLPAKSIDVQNSSYPIDIGKETIKYRDKVTSTAGTLMLKGVYQSETSLPFQVAIKNLRLLGKRNDGVTKDLTFNGSQSINLLMDNSGELNIQFDEKNSNINSFIAFLPDSIILSAEYIMNPENSTEYKSASETDSILFTVKFQTKSMFAISQVTLSDSMEIDFSSDERNKIKDGQGAQIFLEVMNAIPLNSWIKADLYDINDDYLFTITKNISGADSLMISGASVYPDGNVQSPGSSATSIELNQPQIAKLAEAFKVVVSITVETSEYVPGNPQVVIIRPSDSIKLNSYGKITYRVKE